MTTMNTDIKYNNNQLDGLLAGDIVTFLLIHTKYYQIPTNTDIQTTLIENAHTVSASIIEIKRKPHDVVIPPDLKIIIIEPDNNSSNTNKVVTTIQFKLSVDHNYKFAFYKFDKFDIEIFDDVNTPIVKYELITQLNTPINNEKSNTNISPIVNFLSSIITNTENVNNILIDRINNLQHMQKLFNSINELNNKKPNHSLKPQLGVLKSQLDELKHKLDELVKVMKAELVKGVNLDNIIDNIELNIINLKGMKPKLDKLENKSKAELVKGGNRGDIITEISGKRLTNKTIKNLMSRRME